MSHIWDMFQAFTFLNLRNQNFLFTTIDFIAFKRLYPIIFIGLLLLVVCNSCGEKDSKANPEDYFTESQKKAILMQLVLKTAPKPDGNPEHSEIEAYYQSEVQSYYWHYAHEKDGRFYFYISKPAPSLFGKRTGIGGSFKSEDRLSIRDYKEVFRTFKMKHEDLVKKGGIMFEKMVNNQNLKGFEPGGKEAKNSEWIEFPDAHNYFDTIAQTWKTNLSSH